MVRHVSLRATVDTECHRRHAVPMTSIKDGWTAKDIPRQDGRVFVVTGANSGLGFSTARELARHGATVVLAVRNADKGRQALKQIKDEVPAADVDQRPLDLADLDSVRAFAATVPTVHGLVNNAGVMMPPRTLTKQGFELQAHLADPPEHADPVWTIRWLATPSLRISVPCGSSWSLIGLVALRV